MEQHENEEATRRFGSYLRQVRENRRLSLDAVEELSAGYAERVTKSHLSRIENGQAVPSFSRLFTLSRIYGVPVASLAERFEIDLRTQHVSADLVRRSEPDLLEEAAKLRAAGRYVEALALYESLLDRRGEAPGEEAARAVLDLRLHRANCLWHIGCYGLAKDECEEILSSPELLPGRRLLVLENFVICCVNLGRFTVAMMALEQAERDLESPEAPERLGADLSAIRGLVHVVLGEPGRAVEWYRKAIRLYEGIRDPLESCRCAVNLGYALLQSGDASAAEEILGASLATASAAGYARLEALALGTLAVLRFRKGDLAGAEGLALRSNSIARPAEHISLVFRNCFYLWRIAQARGDEGGVRANERTLRVYVSRVEDYVPEVQEFRAHLAGAKP